MKASEKLKNSRGFTLAELVVVLALCSLFAMISVTAILLSTKTSRLSVLESRSEIVSDTLNVTMRDMLANSFNPKTEGGETKFICEKYSGWYLTFREVGGRIDLIIFDEIAGERSEHLLPDPSYAEFQVEDFEFSYSDGVYAVSYNLVSDSFSKSVSAEISRLNA